MPAAGSIVSGVLNVRLPLVEQGTLDAAQASLDGVPLPSVVGADKVVSGSIDTRLLADGTHVLRVDARDRVGNAGSYTVSFTIDNKRPALRIRAPRTVLANSPLLLTTAASDRGSGIAGVPVVAFGDRSTGRGSRIRHRYARPGRYTLRVSVVDRAGNTAVAQQTVRVVGVLVEPSLGTKPAVWVRRARPGNVRVQLAGALVRSLHVGRAPHRVLLGALKHGVYRVTVVAGAARASRLVRVR